MQVSFVNETSQDKGGISREFFTQITKDILSEGIGLFQKANTEEFSYIITAESREIKDYKLLFRFFGRLIGKAFFDRIPVNLCLNRQIYMALLGKTEVDDHWNLKEFMMLNKRIEYTFFKILCYQMARGLSYIHSIGICHRDIRPHNVLVKKNGRVVLCDFGSAKMMRSTEKSLFYMN